MFINPKEVIKNGWLKFPEWMNADQNAKCIQPNAIDFTLDRLFTINHMEMFQLSETSKKMRGGTEVEAKLKGVDLSWLLGTDEAYDCLSDFYVDIPEQVCAILYPRSTLVRNGLFWTTGIYDSGFKGHIGGVLHNRSGLASIAKGTRIGQIAFVRSDSAGAYAGGWNHSIGTHYAEVKIESYPNPPAEIEKVEVAFCDTALKTP